MNRKLKVAIIGSGNIGTDLMIKVMRQGSRVEMAAMAGVDPASEGLARAARLGVATTADGIEGLMRMPVFEEISLVFDATSAAAHRQHASLLENSGVQVIDLTPAAIGPYVVPVVNGEAHRGTKNINMVTCGGQATIPVIAAVSKVVRVHYGEIVASIASRSAGPGTRANIDEFTQTTARAIEVVGGAQCGKAIIILNPAEPPLMMRDTVFTLSEQADERQVADSIGAMVEKVQGYVPGYRLKQEVQFEQAEVALPGAGRIRGLKTTVLLEVRGAAHYLPEYAGNLDIMTSAALACAESQALALVVE
ncbi:acetaldehyde dehydrogenase [Trinickia symbiotica]|uniref:Acetaldehyde dehydrogenase n=1 Tax=Trinickia symbiotica TaxID=863227 RepID=A0A2N7XAU9_9BURK|nr:acetaldehyde dehydrogenase (acetylating) [Trinickia symbiotica]PMS38585.1 acetaldehyde dehydrogenase (acetylating) [Trinickia symbiotica]PPK46581.1 acetaldehyde dehydrogenase [Trinickia symbiotica]